MSALRGVIEANAKSGSVQRIPHTSASGISGLEPGRRRPSTRDTADEAASAYGVRATDLELALPALQMSISSPSPHVFRIIET